MDVKLLSFIEGVFRMKRILSFLGKRSGRNSSRLSANQIEHLCDGDMARKNPELRRQVTLEQVLKSASPRFSADGL
jgi:hypothetical protein